MEQSVRSDSAPVSEGHDTMHHGAPDASRDAAITRMLTVEAPRDAAGRFAKRKAAMPPSPESVKHPPQEDAPLGTVPAPRDAPEGTYALKIKDDSLGLHAARGAGVLVAPEMPTGAGLAVFYLKDAHGPVIFDLTHGFRPEFARPFAPGSEVMPAIEAVAPGTGRVGRLRADRVAKIHRVIGVYTPAEIALKHRPTPAALPVMSACPEGMGEQYVDDAVAYPLVRKGETVIYDPSQREPTHGALCVLQWTGGGRSVMLTNLRQSRGGDEPYWCVDPVNRPANREALDRRLSSGQVGMLYASDGPYDADHLREKIVGTVVGVLMPRRGGEPVTEAEGEAVAKMLTAPEPVTLHTPLPSPGSEEARVAFAEACREHSRLTLFANGYLELKRTPLEWWTKQSLSRARDLGEISASECARLYPIASERELRMDTVSHRLNFGALFALAHADDPPLPAKVAGVEEQAGVVSEEVHAAIEDHRAAIRHGAEEPDDSDEAFQQHSDRQTASDNALRTTPCRSLTDVRAKLTYLVPIMAPDMADETHVAHLKAILDDVDGMCRSPVASASDTDIFARGRPFDEAHNAWLRTIEASREPPVERDWQALAAMHPGFVPYPSEAPAMLMHLDHAIQKEARRFLDLAEAEFERRRQAYLGFHDSAVWPRVARSLRRDMRMDALEIAASDLQDDDSDPLPEVTKHAYAFHGASTELRLATREHERLGPVSV